MWKSKRLILAGLLAIAVIVGGVARVAVAQGEDQGAGTTLVSRVAKILGIEEQKVQDAFDQAQKEMREEALDRYLQWAVEQGKMTQEEANKYKAWWQSQPECPQLKQWQQSRPDVPLLREPLGRFGLKGFRGGGMNGHRLPGQAVPTPTASVSGA